MLGRLPKHIWPGALIKCIPEPPEGLDRFSLAAWKGSAFIAVVQPGLFLMKGGQTCPKRTLDQAR
jgi:hypothetical protein